MNNKIMISTLLLSIIPVVAFADGDPVKGEAVFKKCKICHSVNKPLPKKIGPYLQGVIDRKVGSTSHNYSPAMKKAGAGGLTWTVENLDKYLANPRKFMPGNRMPFAGIRKPQDRANLISYLKKFPKP